MHSIQTIDSPVHHHLTSPIPPPLVKPPALPLTSTAPGRTSHAFTREKTRSAWNSTFWHPFFFGNNVSVGPFVSEEAATPRGQHQPRRETTEPFSVGVPV